MGAIDTALSKRLTDATALHRCAGGRRLRSLAALAAPAESPRRRWPEVQVNLRDDKNRFVGRADLNYPATRLIVEYDGDNHMDRLVEDDRRQNLLVSAGSRLLRFSASDIYNRPDVVEALVRSALA